MSRRPADNDNEVSLFPFLSILACIIGVLTLMISTLALSQMDNDVVVAAEEFERVSRILDEKESNLALLQKAIDVEQAKFSRQASKEQKEHAELQKKLESISLELLAAKKQRDELKDTPDPEQELLKQSLEEIEVELTMHREEIAQLVKQIEERKLPAEEAEFSVLPSGSGTGIKPYFIDCTKTEIVLHQKTGLTRIRLGKINSDVNLIKFFDEVAGDPRAKVIFLIRDDGIHTWWRASQFANSLDVPNGKLPVLGHGRINLDHFINN